MSNSFKIGDSFISVCGAAMEDTGPDAVCVIEEADYNIVLDHNVSAYKLKYPAAGALETVTHSALSNRDLFKPIYTERVLVLSTSHIDEGTAMNLTDEFDEFEDEYGGAIEMEYGWMFTPLKVRIWYEEGNQVPECIRRAAQVADEARCSLLVFDRDIEPCDWLPVYDW